MSSCKPPYYTLYNLLNLKWSKNSVPQQTFSCDGQNLITSYKTTYDIRVNGFMYTKNYKDINIRKTPPSFST